MHSWHLHAVLQVHRWDHPDTDTVQHCFEHTLNTEAQKDPKEGHRNETPKPRIEDNYVSLGLMDVLWTGRMQVTRKEINAFVKSQRKTIQKEAAEWFTIPPLENCKVVVTRAKLHTSIAHTPTVAVDVLYGPTVLSKYHLTREINENFEHWENAGDHAFLVADLVWTKVELDEDSSP